jgi:hypothetical protein
LSLDNRIDGIEAPHFIHRTRHQMRTHNSFALSACSIEAEL